MQASSAQFDTAPPLEISRLVLDAAVIGGIDERALQVDPRRGHTLLDVAVLCNLSRLVLDAAVIGGIDERALQVDPRRGHTLLDIAILCDQANVIEKQIWLGCECKWGACPLGIVSLWE